MCAQVFSRYLNNVMLSEFDGAEIDWNGRRSCFLLSFDCDFPEDALSLPSIAEMLESRGLKGSFACVGRWVEDYPEAHSAVLSTGSELFNHSFSHPELVNSPAHFVSSRNDFNPRRWSDLSREEKVEEVGKCQEIVQSKLGYQMQGFRIPHFGNSRSSDIHGLLNDLGLKYSTSQLSPACPHYGVPFLTQGVLEIPVTSCPRHPFSSFDSWHALYAHGGWHRQDFLQVLQGQVVASAVHGGLTNIYLDPKDIDRLEFARIFDLLAASADECWSPTYSEFAEWWSESKPSSMIREMAG
jgi:peptidoglycan/xylan/chitin deacetylase (PgdA/CDA1 family)